VQVNNTFVQWRSQNFFLILFLLVCKFSPRPFLGWGENLPTQNSLPMHHQHLFLLKLDQYVIRNFYTILHVIVYHIFQSVSVKYVHVPYLCSFSSCAITWTHMNSGQFAWTIHTGSTPSNLTGPTFGSDGRTYAYIESNLPRNEGDKAK